MAAVPRRLLLVLTAAVLVLAALPALPPAAAQASGSAPLAIVYQDDFSSAGDGGWTKATRSVSPGEADSWHKLTDGNQTDSPRVWYASRLADGQPGGYSNGAHVVLTSPAIHAPAGFDLRSLLITLRGSSHAGDVLVLEWAAIPNAPDAQWQTLARWEGIDANLADGDLAASYHQVELTTSAFRAADTVVLRLRFAADSTCDSNPGDPGASAVEPQITPPGPDAVTPPDYTGPVPPDGSGVVPPTVDYDPGYDPATAVDAGETEDGINCATDPVQGWFVDGMAVVGRRDFLSLVQPGAARIPVPASGPAATTDVFTDMGKVLQFRLDPAQTTVPSEVQAVLVRLDRQNSPDLMTLAATRGPDGVWIAELAVDEPELVAGLWDVSFLGTQPGGGSQLATTLLTVRVQDQAVPRLVARPAGAPVELGPGQGLTLEVTEAFLRKVTYTFQGSLQTFDLPFPYVLPVTAFPEGASTVTFRAEDRAGHVAALEVGIERDTVRPVLQILGPPTVYAGVPFDLSLAIIERSAHSVRVDVNGTVVDIVGTAGEAAAGKSTVLKVTPPATGPLTIAAQVTDTLGNEAVQVRQFIAVLPVTDLRVSSVRLATPATNTSAEGHGIVAVVEQVGGVAPLPVTVTFEAAGRSQAYTVTVPASGPFEVRWDTHLPPGVQTVKVNARGPEAANETLPGNENGTATIESFLGRVTIGSKVYTIRSDARGLPTTAVLTGSSKTYPLALVQSGAGVSYQFTADGNRTVLWDPLKPVMELEDASTSSPTSGGKDAPFPGLLMALAVIALAALAQRRK